MRPCAFAIPGLSAARLTTWPTRPRDRLIENARDFAFDETVAQVRKRSFFASVSSDHEIISLEGGVRGRATNSWLAPLWLRPLRGIEFRAGIAKTDAARSL